MSCIFGTHMHQVFVTVVLLERQVQFKCKYRYIASTSSSTLEAQCKFHQWSDPPESTWFPESVSSPGFCQHICSTTFFSSHICKKFVLKPHICSTNFFLFFLDCFLHGSFSQTPKKFVSKPQSPGPKVS